MKNKYVPAFDLAVISLALGENQEALTYLEEAYREREPWMPFIGTNLLFNSLFSDEQFQDLVKRIEKHF